MAGENPSLAERAGDWALAALLALVPLVPPRVGLRLGELLGRAIYWIDARHRRIALGQLREFLGAGKDAPAVAREVFENLGRLMMECFYLGRLSPAGAARRVSFEGLENLWAALAKGRGCLVLTGHFGAFELMPAAFALVHGRRVNIVVREMDWGPAHRALVRLRERCGNRSLAKGGSMRHIIGRLREGEIVGILLDQNVAEREGVFVDFFGRPACTNRGMAQLALHTGAPVVPAFIVYEGSGRHRVVIEPEVELVRSGERERDVQVNTARFTAVVERWVRRHPGHWFWMHRRWKTRPGAGSAHGEGAKGANQNGAGAEAA